MNKDRLTNLVILSIEPEQPKINFNKVTGKFAKVSLRKRTCNIIIHYCDRPIYWYKGLFFAFVFFFLRKHINVIYKVVKLKNGKEKAIQGAGLKSFHVEGITRVNTVYY